MTDLMASVAVTFLLLAAIFMLRATDEKVKAERRLSQVQTFQDSSRDKLERLMAELQGIDLKKAVIEQDKDDRFLLTVEFPDTALHFETGKHEIPSDVVSASVAPLKKVVEKVCDIDQKYTNSIVLEGHTDLQGQSADGGYQRNVKLSGARAQFVFFAVRDRIDNERLRACMDTRFTVSGRGPVQPKDRARKWDDPHRPENEPADRRVVLKIRFTSGGEALNSRS
jgi:flagellar motor protein MotB